MSGENSFVGQIFRFSKFDDVTTSILKQFHYSVNVVTIFKEHFKLDSQELLWLLKIQV